MPELTKIAQAKLGKNKALMSARDARARVFSDRHRQIFADWKAAAEAKRGSDPISYAELTLITWDVIKTRTGCWRRNRP